MPDDKEKVEDFITMWRKKMKDDSNKPSAIAETLERIEEVEKENEQLRTRIKENIDLITRTEEIVRKTIEENEKLKEQVKQSSKVGGSKVSELQTENRDLNNKIQSLTISLTEKDNMLKLKDNQIAELNLKINDATSALEFMANTASAYLVAIPKIPVIHIQNRAPGPPATIAVATPAIFPVPTVAARAVIKA